MRSCGLSTTAACVWVYTQTRVPECSLMPTCVAAQPSDQQPTRREFCDYCTAWSLVFIAHLMASNILGLILLLTLCDLVCEQVHLLLQGKGTHSRETKKHSQGTCMNHIKSGSICKNHNDIKNIQTRHPLATTTKTCCVKLCTGITQMYRDTSHGIFAVRPYTTARQHHAAKTADRTETPLPEHHGLSY